MKYIHYILILFSWVVSSQVNSKIEGIVLNAPCELNYTRNINNQNNYSCIQETNNGYINNYSVTVNNLYNDLAGLTVQQKRIFSEEFHKRVKQNAEEIGEVSKSVKLKNGKNATSVISYLTYGDQKFRNIEIAFLFKKKSYIVNLTSNNLTVSANVEELISLINFY
tara:strand:+ start:24031 stop:24528 length:498 start_codon:yes stop_codon:yes gene_type:complete